MALPKRFEPVEVPDELSPAAQATQSVAVSALGLALRALSQRALAATRDVFTLLSVASVFYVWVSVPDPNVHQIVSHSIYAVVVLAANFIVRRV